MAKILTSHALLSRHVTRKDRVLLVNPPVEETRYSWRRWNQPLDLLKLASRLRRQVECEVELLDFMQPDRKGRVRNVWLPLDRRHYTVKGTRYPMYQIGKPYSLFSEWILSKRTERRSLEPTQVWITSLCSYWYESVAELCRVVRQSLPNAQVVLLGQYARLMPKHACDACAADFVVSLPPDITSEPSALDLYREQRPPFVALQLLPDTAVTDVQEAVNRGIFDFAFFEDDICRDEGHPLLEIVAKTQNLHERLRYHIICGLSPARVTPEIARVLANRKFAELHFEEADSGDSLNLDAYKKARAYLCEAGMKMPTNRLSGFVWVGRPGDQLERLIHRSFQVLDYLGSLILKPFTPTPGSTEQRKHEDYLSAIPHRDWSPHFFPFSELNGITREEYHDLYRTAAFLNEKVRGRAFDFLNGTLGAQLLRESLRKEVWKLEPSPVRLTD
ncbi:MAG: hypothetical protein IH857_00280 [Deltaproteobacteria bacterium]|nr:hypothetical protein [Deltaproteobacteria bacterium]